MRRCCTCKLIKELSDFCKNKLENDGLAKRCRTCAKNCRIKNNYKHLETRKLYRIKTRKHKANYDIKYRIDNAEKIKQYKKQWEFEKRHEPVFKIKRNLRRRIHHVIKDGYKSASTQKLLGCSFQEFKIYLESKFQPGMTWENYGLGKDKWHIDHIRPCCDFNLSISEEQQKCFHYTNMQPLWEKENLKKSYIYQGKNCRIN